MGGSAAKRTMPVSSTPQKGITPKGGNKRFNNCAGMAANPKDMPVQ